MPLTLDLARSAFGDQTGGGAVAHIFQNLREAGQREQVPGLVRAADDGLAALEAGDALGMALALLHAGVLVGFLTEAGAQAALQLEETARRRELGRQGGLAKRKSEQAVGAALACYNEHKSAGEKVAMIEDILRQAPYHISLKTLRRRTKR